MWAIDTEFLVQDEALGQVRIRQFAALLLDDLNVFQVSRALQSGETESARVNLQPRRTHLEPLNCIDRELGKVVLVRG